MNENPFGLNTITKEHWDEVSIAPVGFFGTTPDPDNLLIVKDFIEKEDLKKIQEFYPTITEWIPTPEDAEMVYNDKGQVIYNPDFWRDRRADLWQYPEIYDVVNKYVYKARFLIEEHWAARNRKIQISCRAPEFVCWREGTEQLPHADKQLNSGETGYFPTYDVAGTIYWNSCGEDYEGGELFYPDFDLEFKTEAGSMYSHPGDLNYMHGVNPIISGERWASPCFYKVEKIYDEGD